MKRYAAYIKPYLSAFLLAPLLMLTEVFGEILLPKFMSMIINNGVADRDTGYIIRMGIIMVLTAIVMAAGGIGGAYFSAKASICFTSDLRDALFAKVQNFSFKNIDQYSTGSLVTRLTNDVQQVQNVTMMGLRLLFRAPGMLIGALIMAFLMNAKLALVILIVIPFLSIAIVTIMVKAFPRFTLMQKKIDKLNSGIQEKMQTLYKYCNSGDASADTAYAEYIHLLKTGEEPCEDLRKYVKRMSKSITSRLMTTGRNSEAAEFIGLGLLTPAASKDLYENAVNNENNDIAAYLMEEMKKNIKKPSMKL